MDFWREIFSRSVVGGCIVGALYVVCRFVLALLREKPWRNGQASAPLRYRHFTVGELDPSEWELRIARIVQTEVEVVMEKRNDKLRDLIYEEIVQAMRYFYGSGRDPRERELRRRNRV